MRVNSVALCFGSPVFRKMLGPHFKEGSQLSASAPTEIPLDDDAGIVEIICMAMHLRYDPPLFHQTSSQILEIAKVSDKYDCGKALGALAEFWLKTSATDGDVSSWRDMLTAAYLFRRHEPFAKIARHIIDHATEGVPLLQEDSALSDTINPVISKTVLA